MEDALEIRRINMKSIFLKHGYFLIPRPYSKTSTENKSDGYKNSSGNIFYFYWKLGINKKSTALIINPNIQYDDLLKIANVNFPNKLQKSEGIVWRTQIRELPLKYNGLEKSGYFVGRQFEILESIIPDFLNMLTEKSTQKNNEIKNINQFSKDNHVDVNAVFDMDLDKATLLTTAGQYQDDPKKRKCTELYSVKKACEHYSRLGFLIIEKGKPGGLKYQLQHRG
jgi:hypothetical protein